MTDTIKGFSVGGTIRKYDYRALANVPIIEYVNEQLYSNTFEAGVYNASKYEMVTIADLKKYKTLLLDLYPATGFLIKATGLWLKKTGTNTYSTIAYFSGSQTYKVIFDFVDTAHNVIHARCYGSTLNTRTSTWMVSNTGRNVYTAPTFIDISDYADDDILCFGFNANDVTEDYDITVTLTGVLKETVNF